MALTTVTLHGQILDLDGLTPAVGTVTFKTLIELNDVVDNVTYQPSTFVATLNGTGEFTIILPATDNPDIDPLNWVYQVFINTATWRATEYVQLPFSVGITEFADLERLDYDPCSMTFPLAPVVPPDADAIFVHKAGDTMTGNLIINASLQVNGSAASTFQGFNGDLMRLLSANTSTGVSSGGDITPNGLTQIDITAMTGWIVDFDTSDPYSATNPRITYVSTPAFIGVTPLFGQPTGVCWYMVNSAGVLIQQATQPTAAQRRQNIVIGATAQALGNIVLDQTLPTINSQPMQQYMDLIESLGPFRISGNRLTPNGANLFINKTAGDVFVRAFNHIPDYLNPHVSALAAQTPTQFRHITGVAGSAGVLTTTLNVGSFDPNGLGVITPVGGGANTSTNFRVWGFAGNTPTEQVLIQYGQNTYANLAAAVAAIGTTNFVVNPTAQAAGVLLGWISVVRTATNLSDPTQATFTTTQAKFAQP